MNESLQESLYNKYPKIFEERNWSEDKTCMNFGICCGDGWYGIIDDLCREIMAHCNKIGKPITRATQVKQKFGGLRFYVGNTTDEFMDEIESAEMRSERMCEVCGDSTDIKNIGGWYKCLCDKHSGMV